MKQEMLFLCSGMLKLASLSPLEGGNVAGKPEFHTYQLNLNLWSACSHCKIFDEQRGTLKILNSVGLVISWLVKKCRERSIISCQSSSLVRYLCPPSLTDLTRVENNHRGRTDSTAVTGDRSQEVITLCYTMERC